jgi:hypothetical protein
VAQAQVAALGRNAELTQKYDEIQELLALAKDWDERHSSE